MIVLPAKAGTNDIEAFLRSIQGQPDQALKLPLDTAFGGAFGLSPMLALAFARWARLHTSEREVHLPPSFGDSAEAAERFASTLQGMAALYFATTIRTGGKKVSRYDALQVVKPFVDAMERSAYRDTARGPTVLLCCFESAEREFLRSLYAVSARGDEEHVTVRSISECADLVRDIFAAIGLQNAADDETRRLFGELIFQLWRNADMHTVRDPATKEPYGMGIRGLLVRRVGVSNLKDAANSIIGTAANRDSGLATYLMKAKAGFGAARPTVGPAGKLGGRDAGTFIELSIFDTGPGMALSWLHKNRGATNYRDFSLVEEIDAVKECFTKHLRALSQSDFHDRGLTFVLNTLARLNAFMALRTGRLSLYQDFSRSRPAGRSVEFAPTLKLSPQRPPAEIAGTSFTLSVPLWQREPGPPQ
jgi:hypothetical protein